MHNVNGTMRILDDHVESHAFDPDGRRLASGSYDNTVRIWDANSGAQIALLAGHEGRVDSVAFSPDGRLIVSASSDLTIRLWDTRTRAPVALLLSHEDSVTSVGFAHDGLRVVSRSRDGTIRIWDALTSVCLEVIPGEGHTQACAASLRNCSVRAMRRGPETVIETVADGAEVAWFPAALSNLTIHPFSPVWASTNLGHLLIRLEGTIFVR